MSEAQSIQQRTPIEPSEAHVLVVEDNVPNFVLIARMLAFMGVQRCEWKTSGWQVVQFADTLPRVDLILMDIQMPLKDGYAATREIRALPGEKHRRLPIIALSAATTEDVQVEAVRCGMDGFLTKPINPTELKGKIHRYLQAVDSLTA